MEKTIDNYIMTLKTGVPELRNHFGGHGSSSQSSSPSIYMAEYVLYLTATNIVFLYNVFRDYQSKQNQGLFF